MNQTAWETIERTLQVLTPTDKLELIERVARSLRAAKEPVEPAQQQQAWQQLRARLAVLPVHNPTDGFSNRDHDTVLYGGSAS